MRSTMIKNPSRQVSQVTNIYVDYGSILPEAKRQMLILRLVLMRLLAKTLLAEFHTDLELIRQRLRYNDYILYELHL